MVEILIEGLELHSYHGVTEEERKVGQRLRIDARLGIWEEASTTDSIDDTVDYAKVCALLADAATTRSYKTLEKLASVMANELLDQFSRVDSLEVELRKLSPPVSQEVRALGVRVNVQRRT